MLYWLMRWVTTLDLHMTQVSFTKTAKDTFSENSVGGVDSAGGDGGSGGSVLVLLVDALTVMIVVFLLVV